MLWKGKEASLAAARDAAAAEESKAFLLEALRLSGGSVGEATKLAELGARQVRRMIKKLGLAEEVSRIRRLKRSAPEPTEPNLAASP